MSHSFLIIPVEVIPEWTKENVPTYRGAVVSNDGLFLLMDDAHPLSTYQKWLGPEFHKYQEILDASTRATREEVMALKGDPSSIWYREEEE